ncbi:hypothetical protein ABZY06_28710 [Streptomyces sp. NPDC006540]|uniref:hypothetical protein n=1 Tax=Streptomyces sp. NPDC006540 TaxID=3155353 RepID=UPI0033A84477
MQHSAAAWLIDIALTVRVFGPDAVRCCRRLLAAGVRIGITDISGAARRAATEPEDEHLEAER